MSVGSSRLHLSILCGTIRSFARLYTQTSTLCPISFCIRLALQCLHCFECLSSIVVCDRFVTGPCVDPVNVGAMFSFDRLPGSMLSSVISAAICCNQRSRLRRHVGNGPELPGVARIRCFPEDSDGCMAPSSRGVMKDHEGSDGCTAPSSRGILKFVMSSGHMVGCLPSVFLFLVAVVPKS